VTAAILEQRQALGLRLRELRREAGITGRKLAELAGWHESKTSKIEYGKQTPTEADLQLWCQHTNSLEQLPDLIATLRNIENAYMEFRRVLGTGTRRRQRMLVKTEGETTATRWYEPYVMPGLLQTPEYIEWILSKVIEFYDVPNDLEDGVAARIERQRVLYQGKHQFSFIIAEQVLKTTAKDNSVMLGQLDRLLTVMSLPRVLLGIVPEHAPYDGPSLNGFVIYDKRLVHVETTSAELSITQPREIDMYGKIFALLSERAVYGNAARELIRRAMEIRRESA